MNLVVFLSASPALAEVGYRQISINVEDVFGDIVRTDVAVWYPTSQKAELETYRFGKNTVTTKIAKNSVVKKGEFPLVIYSHGAMGCGLSGSFIGEELVRNGFIVAAPDYPDRYYGCRIAKRIPFKRRRPLLMLRWIKNIRENILNRKAGEYRERLAYRPALLRAVIDRLLIDSRDPESPWHGRLRDGSVGLVGHSFGAWTSLLVGGADSRYVDKRIGAVVALSGPVNKNVYRVRSKNDLAGLRAPTLFVYGEEEPNVGRQSDLELLYHPAASPKALAKIPGADHFTFSGGIRKEFDDTRSYYTRDERRKAITDLTILFLRGFLDGDKGSVDEFLKRPEIEEYDFEETIPPSPR